MFMVMSFVFLLPIQSFSKPVASKPTRITRDPTEPVIEGAVVTTSKEKKEATTYVLSSIIYSPNRRLARINATYVKVGDKLAEATVAKINRNSVVLTVSGKKIILHLLEQEGWE